MSKARETVAFQPAVSLTLVPGARIGPYEVLAPLGAGGMGEVYRARDTRLGREVAIKVIPFGMTDDPQRLGRFEQEARAAGAINHPNVLAVFDVGRYGESPYLVTELLAGRTLRDRLAEGPLPLSQAVDLALQTARGLAAAHEAGIVHRDLKPENLFLTLDDRVKVLDFGLAKIEPLVPSADSQETSSLTQPKLTEPGMVLGSIGYMSPEQVRGHPADHRSDLFAFGAILFEVLSGQRAFWGDSAVGTMNAILEASPPDLQELDPDTPSALARLVRHCLEKNPEQRYQSARDLAFDLETIQVASGPSAPAPQPQSPGSSWSLVPGRRWAARLGGLVLLAATLGAGWLAGAWVSRRPPPAFRQISFRRGVVQEARFTPDGQTVIYGASWEGASLQVYMARPENPESRSMGLPSSGLLDVSSTGELALCRNPRFLMGPYTFGTLSRVPLTGDAPRDLVENVQWADWDPAGSDLAVVRARDERIRLEYPVGTVLYDTAGWISHPRFSPRGDQIAFLDHPTIGGDRGSVAVVNLRGEVKTLSPGWVSTAGLAWSPTGDEVWFSGSRSGMATSLYAVSTSGRLRLLARGAGRLRLHDVARDGRALVSRDEDRQEILARPPGATRERHLDWLDSPTARDLSPDGRRLLFDERGEGGGPNFGVYLRDTDGSEAVQLGPGAAMALSPDGHWALSIDYSTPPGPRLVLLPTGPGQDRPLPRHSIQSYHWATWLPDGQTLLFSGSERDQGVRLYLQDLEGHPPRPITPEGVYYGAVSPDSQAIAAVDLDRVATLYPLDGSEPRPIPGLGVNDIPIRWTPDGQSLYIYRRGDMPAHVVRVEVSTGQVTPWREIQPPDQAGVVRVFAILITPDARSYVYTYQRVLSDLYLVEGLK